MPDFTLPADVHARAAALDAADPLREFRSRFIVPSKAQIASPSLQALNIDRTAPTADDACTYLVGNSLGLQPRATSARVREYLDIWAGQGVQGHWRTLAGCTHAPWKDADAQAAARVAPLLGARAAEVALMQTLSANLHLLLCVFYCPTAARHQIILERKAFPSDNIIVETQLRHHGRDPSESMVTIPLGDDGLLTTEAITATIRAHASTAAVLLLPGVQYYSGQLLDVAGITAEAHQHGIAVVWDLAHAVGNVPLALHDWGVDGAAWCSYKYLNGGPGAIGGLFLHERHAEPSEAATEQSIRRSPHGQLAGWWGNDKTTRFAMATDVAFVPAPGAAGLQLSNPSIIDTTAVLASLDEFEAAGGIAPLRAKSVALTGFLAGLLGERSGEDEVLPARLRARFRIITPADPAQRGAQLSILLLPAGGGEPGVSTDGSDSSGLLDPVMAHLVAAGILVDERRPDVIRVAPAPLYNSYTDCAVFVEAFARALDTAVTEQEGVV